MRATLALCVLVSLLSACGDAHEDLNPAPSNPLRALATTEAWTMPALEDEVHVVRTEGNVPHIYASTRKDAAFIEGFTVARDRYFMMDLARRLGLGKISGLLGDYALDRLIPAVDAGGGHEGIRHVGHVAVDMGPAPPGEVRVAAVELSRQRSAVFDTDLEVRNHRQDAAPRGGDAEGRSAGESQVVPARRRRMDGGRGEPWVFGHDVHVRVGAGDADGGEHEGRRGPGQEYHPGRSIGDSLLTGRGGQSAFADQAALWLGNEAYPLRYSVQNVVAGAIGHEVYGP